jgi:hypothetical protein
LQVVRAGASVVALFLPKVVLWWPIDSVNNNYYRNKSKKKLTWGWRG